MIVKSLQIVTKMEFEVFVKALLNQVLRKNSRYRGTEFGDFCNAFYSQSERINLNHQTNFLEKNIPEFKW